MHYYRYGEKILAFNTEKNLSSEFIKVTEDTASKTDDILIGFSSNKAYKEKMFYKAIDMDPSRESLDYYISDSQIQLEYPQWVKEKISQGRAGFFNENYIFDLEKNIGQILKRIGEGKKARLNVLGLGDVGGILLIGLKTLAYDVIESIGIYDLDEKKLKRWEAELNQIIDPNNDDLPEVKILDYDDLFDCDMFVFCASKGVPPVGSEVKDVRKYQLESNSKLISIYAKEARKKKFKGIFSVVSDPVDQLCNVAYKVSNTNEEGVLDYRGMLPEQVRGYGLGVMYARSLYYLKSNGKDFKNARAYGPHGKELVIANDILAYDDGLSREITKKTVHANMDIRAYGYKPFIAPALSSGAISLINTLRGEWHYSAVYLDGCYFGIRNRLSPMGGEIEKLNLDEKLKLRIKEAYEVLKYE